MVKTDPFFGGAYVIKPKLEARFPWLQEQHPDERYQVGKGWLNLLEAFFADVEAALPDGKGFELTTLYAQRGGLRLAYRLGADVPVAAAARIALARQLAQGRAGHTCEGCGEPGQLYSVGDYWVVACSSKYIEGEAAIREAKPFRRVGDSVGTVAGDLSVQYLPDRDRLVRVARWRERSVISETEDSDLLAEATRLIERSRAAERLAAAQQQIAAEGKMSDRDPDATEIEIMEEATRLQRDARDGASFPLRWMCTQCFTEGVGPWPSFCPNCGQEAGWYSPPGDDPRPAKERWDELLSYLPQGRKDHSDD